MAITSKTVSSVVSKIDIGTDDHVQEQLANVGHRCRECKRLIEDESSVNEFGSAFYFGEISEQTGKFVDILSLTH